MFACETNARIVLELLLDFFEIPAITDVHQFDIVVFCRKIFPHGVQEFQILFLGNSTDKCKPYLFLRAVMAELFPSSFSAQRSREFFKREPAGENLHLVRRDFQVLFQNVRIVFARANDGACHPVENAHQPKHVGVHPLCFHERLCVSGNVGAVMAEHLDSCNHAAKTNGPGTGTRRFEFDHVNGVALEQPQYGRNARDGKFAVRITELFHAEQSWQQNAIAVFDDSARARVEGAPGKVCFHAVASHVRNHVPQVVRDAVRFI